MKARLFALFALAAAARASPRPAPRRTPATRPDTVSGMKEHAVMSLALQGDGELVRTQGAGAVHAARADRRRVQEARRRDLQEDQRPTRSCSSDWLTGHTYDRGKLQADELRNPARDGTEHTFRKLRSRVKSRRTGSRRRGEGDPRRRRVQQRRHSRHRHGVASDEVRPRRRKPARRRVTPGRRGYRRGRSWSRGSGDFLADFDAVPQVRCPGAGGRFLVPFASGSNSTPDRRSRPRSRSRCHNEPTELPERAARPARRPVRATERTGVHRVAPSGMNLGKYRNAVSVTACLPAGRENGLLRAVGVGEGSRVRPGCRANRRILSHQQMLKPPSPVATIFRSDTIFSVFPRP